MMRVLREAIMLGVNKSSQEVFIPKALGLTASVTHFEFFVGVNFANGSVAVSVAVAGFHPM